MMLFKKNILILLGCACVVLGGLLLKTACKKEAQFPVYPEYVVDIGKSYKENISFLIADVRYKEGSLKFLELGVGLTSRFSGYENYFYEGILWERFWLFLKQFNLPVWFVSFRSLKTVHDVELIRKRFSIDAFEKNGWTFCPSFNHLAQNQAFLQCAQKPLVVNPEKFNYKGIIVTRPEHSYKWSDIEKHCKCACKKCADVRLAKARYKDFLFIDEMTAVYAAHKNVMAKLFFDEPLFQYRPHYKIVKKHYKKTLAQEIIQQFKCNKFVVKPLNAFKGRGIIIVSKDNLDMILKYIIDEPYRFKNSDDTSYKYWFSDKNDVLIVESYESSKPVKLKNKLYDATLRVVYTLHYLDGKIHLNFLGEYWKLPSKSLSDQGSLIEVCKSNVHRPGIMSLLVDNVDTAGVHELLKRSLPLMYEKMLKRENPYAHVE